VSVVLLVLLACGSTVTVSTAGISFLGLNFKHKSYGGDGDDNGGDGGSDGYSRGVVGGWHLRWQNW
jgi:hypothetical protein